VTQPAVPDLSQVVVRRRIHVRGIVQGIGYRPYVFRLAHHLHLTGFVLNHSEGVTAEVEGSTGQVDAFLQSLTQQPPPLALIESVATETLEPQLDREFRIIESESHAAAFTFVPADLATCPECLAEMRNPKDRRYRYPFLNCTHCGPRYSVIRDVPYDRPFTTMAGFQMCAPCRREYDDPANRRFHAQPTACPECGPELQLHEEGSTIADRDEALRETQKQLAAGQIVAIKGLGGFHLACDASSGTAVAELRRRKHRPAKPFAVMMPDLEAVRQVCHVGALEQASLTSVQSPIVILEKLSLCTIAEAVAPHERTLGVMLPYTPLHHLLFDGAPYEALVMTSGNLSEEPICTTNEEALERLQKIADCFLLHDRPIETPVDDSVVRIDLGSERPLRRSRGYAPIPIRLKKAFPQIVAAGGQQKNTFCLTRDGQAILSPHIGDLESYESQQFYLRALRHMRRFFRIDKPELLAYDLHPNYSSTELARQEARAPLFGVQHHHAHIASCLAEHGIDTETEGPVIGVALDGTGYGTDGHIWGGEFLLATAQGFERRAHIRYVPLPGGEAAVREPWRVALSYLHDAGLNLEGASELGIPEGRLRAVERLIRTRVNSPLTSSCGRLFDAVAAMLGLGSTVSYEGEAAVRLEALAAPGVFESLAFDLNEDELDFRPATVELQSVKRVVPAPMLAARFHETLAQATLAVCRRIRKQDGVGRVCLSGGCYQNARLLRRTHQLLTVEGFQVFVHARVPANDGGLSLGQALVAAANLS
jgi:hydrogenase maturation protein HypF